MSRVLLDQLLGEIESNKTRVQPRTALEYIQAVYRGEIEADPWRFRAANAALPFESPKLAVIGHIGEDGTFAERLDRALTRSGHNPPKAPPKLITYRPARGDDV
jgi:hypothetical protein